LLWLCCLVGEEATDANPFRVRAYRRAADTLSTLRDDLGDLLERKGQEALIALPNIGKGIAAHRTETIQPGWHRLAAALIYLEVKCAGAHSAGDPHAACDVAGVENGATE